MEIHAVTWWTGEKLLSVFLLTSISFSMVITKLIYHVKLFIISYVVLQSGPSH